MTTIFLIRHGAHALLGRTLCGRRTDVALDSEGVRQAMILAAQLSRRGIARVISSPRLRCRQTAQPIADACGAAVELAPALDETDFGRWAGLRFDTLGRDPLWQAWNVRRGSVRPPGGESMAELQARVVGFLRTLRQGRVGQRIAVVSHAEPIRAALLHARGMSLDDFAQVPVEPGSVHALTLDPVTGDLIPPAIDAEARGAA